MNTLIETLPATGPGGETPQPGAVFHRRTISAHSLEQALGHAAARLARSYPDVPLIEIRERVEAEAHKLEAGAVVTTFVPLLAERRVAATLRRKPAPTDAAPDRASESRRPAA